MHSTVNCGHGRIETRTIEVVSAAECRVNWPGLQQVGRITRTRTIKKTGATATTVVYFITSLPESAVCAAKLLVINRSHWGVENKLFWVKDNVFMEDRSTIRTKKSPEVMTILRNKAVKLLKNIHESTTIAREICSINNQIAINQCVGG